MKNILKACYSRIAFFVLTFICCILLFESVILFQDCFFVAVVIKNRLELHDKPVAVCHSDNPKGTAEISSANYPARAYGLSYTKVISLKLSCAMDRDFSVFVLI